MASATPEGTLAAKATAEATAMAIRRQAREENRKNYAKKVFYFVAAGKSFAATATTRLKVYYVSWPSPLCDTRRLLPLPTRHSALAATPATLCPSRPLGECVF